MSETKSRQEKITLLEARISFAFPQDMKDILTKIATSEGRSLSNLIRLTLLDKIKEKSVLKARKKINLGKQN